MIFDNMSYVCHIGLVSNPKSNSPCVQKLIQIEVNVHQMTIFVETAETMKKILLLILTSLVLFACQKEDTEPVANGFVTHEYTCPKCGAKYSVTCKGPNIQTMTSSPVVPFEEDDIWTLITNPSWGEWTVADESGQNVPYYEYRDYTKMYFICTCEEKSKEFKKDEFKPQIFKP